MSGSRTCFILPLFCWNSRTNSTYMLGLHEYIDVHVADSHLNGISDIQLIAPVPHPPQHLQAFLDLYCSPWMKTRCSSHSRWTSSSISIITGLSLFSQATIYTVLMKWRTQTLTVLVCFYESITEYLRYEWIYKEQSFAFYGSTDWQAKIKGYS